MTDCRKSSNEREFCPHCRLCYCSEECRVSHWIETHQFNCPEYLNFKLEDLKEVSDAALRILGKGSYGEVKLYKHKGTAILYAVKIISKEFIRKFSNISVLLREIAVHKNLRHPNIIQLVKYFEDAERVYIVLEYASKGSLFRIIRRQKGLDESVAWKYFTETCLGIKYLHDNEIIHRDLKPENILIDKFDRVKICDFGWCVKSTDVRNTFCGTLDYMAPEMLLSEGHSYQVDLWALGVLLYELLHGYAPFRAAKDSEKRQQILANEITFAPGMPTLAKDLILKLVKSNPRDRLHLDKILGHPWIAKFAQKHDIEVGMQVNHPRLEIGQILEVSGMICKVKFRDRISYITVPDIIPILFVEKEEEPRPTISILERKVFDDLEKWCLGPTRSRRKLRELQKEFFELDENAGEVNGKSGKRKGSIDCFEEIVERSSVRNREGDQENGVESGVEKGKHGQEGAFYEENNSNLAIKTDIYGGLFESEEEFRKIREMNLKNSKKMEKGRRGAIKEPKSKELFTKDSTGFQSCFDVRNRIDLSNEATESKKQQLNQIRRTLEQTNAKKIKKKKERGFWSSLFGCIDR